MASDCDRADACQVGVCEPNLALDGASCGDCASGYCDACSAGTCASCLSTPGALTTMFEHNGSADGIMFNVEALEKLRITGLSLNLAAGFSGAFEVYINPDGGVGDEEDAAKWTLVFSKDLTSAGTNTPTFMSMAGSELELAAGETLGLYVTSTATAQNAQLYFTEGTTAGDTAVTNSQFAIKYGNRLEYPFVLLSAVKLWSGTVHYELCD